MDTDAMFRAHRLSLCIGPVSYSIHITRSPWKKGESTSWLTSGSGSLALIDHRERPVHCCWQSTLLTARVLADPVSQMGTCIIQIRLFDNFKTQ